MAATSLAEADLHSLVDGHIEPERRADLLRRLAVSPADRAQVDAWQDQSDTIRAAFREVAHETLPVALDLAPPRLRTVEPEALHPARPAARRGGGGAAAVATALLIMIGLAASWVLGSREETAADTAPVAAERATATPVPTAGLPSIRIPDLTASGLTLASVTSEDEPAKIVLRYRDDGDGRVTVGVARNAAGMVPVAQQGQALTWRSRAAAFTLAGTLPPARLRAIAVALQADQGTD